jgi:hypothetical protein
MATSTIPWSENYLIGQPSGGNTNVENLDEDSISLVDSAVSAESEFETLL